MCARGWVHRYVGAGVQRHPKGQRHLVLEAFEHGRPARKQPHTSLHRHTCTERATKQVRAAAYCAGHATACTGLRTRCVNVSSTVCSTRKVSLTANCKCPKWGRACARWDDWHSSVDHARDRIIDRVCRCLAIRVHGVPQVKKIACCQDLCDI